MRLRLSVLGYEVWCLELVRTIEVSLAGDDEEDDADEEEERPRRCKHIGGGASHNFERDIQPAWSDEYQEDEFGFR